MKQNKDIDLLMNEFLLESYHLNLPTTPCSINGFYPLTDDETNLISAQIGYDLSIEAKGRDVWYHHDTLENKIFFFIGTLDEVKAAIRKGIDNLSVIKVMSV